MYKLDELISRQLLILILLMNEQSNGLVEDLTNNTFCKYLVVNVIEADVYRNATEND
jgi:hypothetical protein